MTSGGEGIAQARPASRGAIVKTLEQRIAPLEDPRKIGSALVGEHAGYWRWRIGDYGVVARIEDERITVLVVGVPHSRASF